MDETLPRSTPDNAEHALSFPSVLEIAADADDERPAKLPRVAAERPLPASDRPTILRSVVKGVDYPWLSVLFRRGYMLRDEARREVTCLLPQ